MVGTVENDGDDSKSNLGYFKLNVSKSEPCLHKIPNNSEKRTHKNLIKRIVEEQIIHNLHFLFQAPSLHGRRTGSYTHTIRYDIN